MGRLLGKVCLCRCSSCTSSYTQEGHPNATENGWRKIFSFSSSNFLPWHWLGPPPLPLPSPPSGSRQEGKSCVHTWKHRPDENTKASHPTVHTFSSFPGKPRWNVSPGPTCDCVWESAPPRPLPAPTHLGGAFLLSPSALGPPTTIHPVNAAGWQKGGGFLKISLNPKWRRGKRSFLNIGLRLAPRILIFP